MQDFPKKIVKISKHLNSITLKKFKTDLNDVFQQLGWEVLVFSMVKVQLEFLVFIL